MHDINWDDFFESQRGGNFVGYRYQRGGLAFGSLIGGVFKKLLPFLKSAGKSIGKAALNTGIGVAGDVLQGHNVADSFEARGKQAAAKLLNKGTRALAGRKRVKRKQQRGTGLGRRPKRRHRDLFA